MGKSRNVASLVLSIFMGSLVLSCSSVTNREVRSIPKCPKSNFEFFAEHHLSEFSGCSSGERATFKNGTSFECIDNITVDEYTGPVSVLKWSEDNLQCYSEAELLRDGMKKYCKDRADSFEQSLKLRRYRKFSDFSLPVAFTGKVRNYSLAHRIVLTADGNNSYAIYYNNEIQLPMVAECQMIDAKEQKFWYQLF